MAIRIQPQRAAKRRPQPATVEPQSGTTPEMPPDEWLLLAAAQMHGQGRLVEPEEKSGG